MPRIHFEKIVNAKRDYVFKIATDYESFQTILPQYFPFIRVRSIRDNVSVIEEHLKLAGKELVMMTKHVITLPDLHDIFVIGGDAKGSHISERYEEIPQGTKIILNANIKLKGVMKVTGFFEKNKIENGFSKIVDEFVKIAET